MVTWFIRLRRGDGREEFRSCKRDTEGEARAEAERFAGVAGEGVEVVDVRPLRGASPALDA